MRAISLSAAFLVALPSLVNSISALAFTPPPVTSVNSAPESPLGDRYYGGLSGTASVSAAGNAAYQLDIVVPPGTGEATPKLTLAYNSNVGNGPLGYGWFLQGTESKITRCPKTEAQDGERHAVDYSMEDRFCLNGNRLVVVSGTYGASGSEYRTEVDQFSRVISHGSAGNGPAYFTVELKNGHKQEFGNTTKSAVEAETGSTIRMWRLNRHEDKAGNYMDYIYKETTSTGVSYLETIEYGGNDNTGQSHFAQVNLVWQARSDDFVSYQAGSEIRAHHRRPSWIQSRVDGALVGEYRLVYEEVGLRNQSRLTSVKRRDALGTWSDPLNIEYKHDGAIGYTASWETTFDYRGPNSSGWSRTLPTGYPRWHDLNGDGRDDYIVNDPTGEDKKEFDVLLSGPSGYTSEVWYTTMDFNRTRAHWADMDGDGATDLVLLDQNYGGNISVNFSRPGGFVSQWFGNGPRSHEFLFVDMDGDHLPDAVAIDRVSSTYTVFVAINQGSSFSSFQSWTANVIEQPTVADFNGDGLPDVIEEKRWVRLNDGSGFGPRIDWGGGAIHSVTFGDYNGDGLTDRRSRGSHQGDWYLEINNGESFEPGVLNPFALSVDMNRDGLNDRVNHEVITHTAGWQINRSSLSVEHSASLGDSSSGPVTVLRPEIDGWDRYSGVGDFNGDGFLDLSIKETFQCFSGHQNWYFYYYFCETDQSRLFTNDGDRIGLVSRITESSGREIEFDYDWLASGTSTYIKGASATLPELDLQDSTRVVKRFRVSDGIGGDSETTYQYKGYKWNLNGRGILGFDYIDARNTSTDTRTVTYYEQSFPLVMQPKKIIRRRLSDNRLLGRKDMRYTLQGTVGSGPVSVYLDLLIEWDIALADSSTLEIKYTYVTQDSYGNTTELKTVSDDQYNGVTREIVTTNTFTNSVASWRIGQLDSTSTKFWKNGGMSSSDTRRTDYTYGSTYGLLKNTVREPSGGVGISVTTARTHDAFGNVLTETISGPGLPARTTTIAYDTRGQFPTTITNALGHVTTQTWDGDFGHKLSETDPNGLTTTWNYDSFGNQVSETRPDGTTVSSMMYRDPTGSGVNAAFYTEILETGKAPKRVFVDLLGRTVRERTQTFNGDYVNVDREYNAAGRMSRQSEPYFDWDVRAWNQFTYDVLGRVTALAAADPVGSNTTVYNGFSSTVTDSSGRSETRVVDAEDRVIRVTDKAGVDTVMSYDAQGNRTMVTAASGTANSSIVLYDYDRYGRLISQNDLDHGLYTYTYDALGHKLSEVSPKMAAASQTRTFTYDLLGRMTSRSEPEGTATWAYDYAASGNLGIGKLRSESSAGLLRELSYASAGHGRLTRIRTVIGGVAYIEEKTYNSNGNLESERYPASALSPQGFKVRYDYNALGYMERVKADSGSDVYYQLLDTDAAGRITSEWLGDGSTVTQTYAGESARIASQLSERPGQNLVQSFAYTYDSAGNMLSRSSPNQSLTETFTYDNMDRLTSAQVSGQAAVQYAFDEMGSITQKSDIADSFDYLGPQAHAVTLTTLGAVTNTLSYDDNGNYQSGSNRPTVTWSSYNKPTQLTKGAITYNFFYGPGRTRYLKQRASASTHYVGTRFEHTTSGTLSEYRHVISANGRPVMLRETRSNSPSPVHKFLHLDHLGSITAITNGTTGNVVDRLSYDAWGKRRSPLTWTSGLVTASYNRGYTGHEHLDDIDIIHMNGRIYEPTLGRMLSPDPVTQEPENGQNYNRYTYAFNNPLRYTDPTGYEFGDKLGGRRFTQYDVIGDIGQDDIDYMDRLEDAQDCADIPWLCSGGRQSPPGVNNGCVGGLSSGGVCARVAQLSVRNPAPEALAGDVYNAAGELSMRDRGGLRELLNGSVTVSDISDLQNVIGKASTEDLRTILELVEPGAYTRWTDFQVNSVAREMLRGEAFEIGVRRLTQAVAANLESAASALATVPLSQIASAAGVSTRIVNLVDLAFTGTSLRRLDRNHPSRVLSGLIKKYN